MKGTVVRLLLIAVLAAPAAAGEWGTVGLSASPRGSDAAAVSVKDGRVLVVDLGALPAGAAVGRALLYPGWDERELVKPRREPVRLAEKESGAEAPLAGPRFLAFDVTAAVRRAVAAGKKTVAFDAAAVPGLRADRVRVDVTGAVQPKGPVPRVSGVRAWHRAGQTFLTWQEADSPAGGREITFQQWRARADKPGGSPAVVYRIYRSLVPFTAEAWARAELVDEVGQMTGFNPDRYGGEGKPEQAVPRFVVEEGKEPVAPGTGIYVHNPARPGRAYYAVSVAVQGEEHLAALGEGSIAGPVEETVGPGEPVLQRIERPASFNYVDRPTLHYYVRWEAPPRSNVPSRPIDYVVGVPPKLREPAPVGLHLHCWGGSLEGGYGWWYNAGQGALLIATNQLPYDWWTGYHECRGTGRSWSEGRVREYSQTRVLAFLDWVATRWKVDPARVFTAGNSMGGSGSPSLGLRHADRVAWVGSWVGVHVPARSPVFRGSYENVYGPVEWRLPGPDGRTPAFTYYDDTGYLRQDPGRDAPLVCFSNGKNDGAIGWPQARDFWAALQEARQPHVFVWGQAGHGQRAMLAGPRPQERELGLDVATNRTLPAFTRCSLDDQPGGGDPAEGDPKGQSNLYLSWDDKDVADEAGAWGLTVQLNADAPKERATVDVTPRRCQKFKVRPGEAVRWRSMAGGRVVQEGQAAADRWGLVTVPGVEVTKEGRRLEIRAEGR